jgi:hypothetical protein
MRSDFAFRRVVRANRLAHEARTGTGQAAPFRSFDGMAWPVPCQRMDEIEYALRYNPESADELRLIAASVISAYGALISMPSRQREAIIRELRNGPGKE